MNILYVEDEKSIIQAIATILKKNNYNIEVAYDGEEGLGYALTGLYDIIILDVMLPKRSGIEILQEIRKAGMNTPVILLTAKSDLQDRIKGLDSGADDYLSKPFQTEELLARLRALARRIGKIQPDHIIRFGDLELNPITLDLSCLNEGFRLTLKESQLLELLIQNHNSVVTPNMIIEKLWGYDSEAEDNHVRVHMAFLRKKLRLLKSTVEIVTVRGLGYSIHS